MFIQYMKKSVTRIVSEEEEGDVGEKEEGVVLRVRRGWL